MKCAFRASCGWEEDVIKKTDEYIEELSDSVHGWKLAGDAGPSASTGQAGMDSVSVVPLEVVSGFVIEHVASGENLVSNHIMRNSLASFNSSKFGGRALSKPKP